MLAPGERTHAYSLKASGTLTPTKSEWITRKHAVTYISRSSPFSRTLHFQYTDLTPKFGGPAQPKPEHLVRSEISNMSRPERDVPGPRPWERDANSDRPFTSSSSSNTYTYSQSNSPPPYEHISYSHPVHGRCRSSPAAYRRYTHPSAPDDPYTEAECAAISIEREIVVTLRNLETDAHATWESVQDLLHAYGAFQPTIAMFGGRYQSLEAGQRRRCEASWRWNSTDHDKEECLRRHHRLYAREIHPRQRAFDEARHRELKTRLQLGELRRELRDLKDRLSGRERIVVW
jgi:hypothetical protein